MAGKIHISDSVWNWNDVEEFRIKIIASEPSISLQVAKVLS